MNSRERALRAIRFEFPDKIPITYSVPPSALLRHGGELKDLLRKYPNDFWDVNSMEIPSPEKKFYREDGSYYRESVDEWGAVWEQYIEGIAGGVKKAPLDDWSKLEDLRIPPHPLAKPGDKEKCKVEIEKQKERYVGWGAVEPVFERMQWLRGTEDLFIDIAEDGKEVYVLADRILAEYTIPLIKANIETGVDVMGFGEDWGSQDRLLISPSSWRRIFKPRYKKMFDICKEAEVLIWFHSDGMILEIIPDFIELGVDILNPQLSCMDLEKLREVTYKKIGICGDIDRQLVLPRGKPEEVRGYINKVYEIFGDPAGGFVYHGGIENAPFENIEAMLKAFYEFRDLERKSSIVPGPVNRKAKPIPGSQTEFGVKR